MFEHPIRPDEAWTVGNWTHLDSRVREFDAGFAVSTDDALIDLERDCFTAREAFTRFD